MRFTKFIITVFLISSTAISFSQNIYNLTGLPNSLGDGGPSQMALVYSPRGVSADKFGNIYLTDQSSRIRRINSIGIINTVAGNGSQGFSGDGGLAVNAQIYGALDIEADEKGNFYIADTDNNRIRKVNSNGIISTIAGTGAMGHSGDGGSALAADIDQPQAITVDRKGNIYFSEDASYIRKIDTLGIITTIAGQGGFCCFSGDGGPANLAQFNGAWGLKTDTLGNLYFTDTFNHVVRKIDTSGTITTIAGIGQYYGLGAEGVSATTSYLSIPHDVDIDNNGNIYIADHGNNRVRKIDKNGIISTICSGPTLVGDAGDGGPAISAKINGPRGIAVNSSGNIIFADWGNSRAKIICNSSCLQNVQTDMYSKTPKLYPNPSHGMLNIINEEGDYIEFIGSLGKAIFNCKLSRGTNQIQLPVEDGIYYYKIVRNNQPISSGKIIIQK